MDFEGTTTHAPELATANQGNEAGNTVSDEAEIETFAGAGEGEEATSESHAETEGEDAKGENTEGEGLIPIEYEGKTYNLPAELKDAFLRNADYTRKTQEVAEMRRAAEAKMAEVEQNFSVSEEVLGARAALMNVDQSLQQFQNVDWIAYQNEDPIGAHSAWIQYQQLREQRGTIATFLDQRQAEWTAQGEQATAKRLQETAEFAQKNIPGWSPEVDAKITDFATKELGFERGVLTQALTPQVYRALHLAWIGAQSLKKQNSPPPQNAPASAPLQKVTARANPPASGLDDRLSAEEWMKRRNAQVRRG